MVMSIETPSDDKVLYVSIPVSKRCVLFISELIKMIIPCHVSILDVFLSVLNIISKHEYNDFHVIFLL